MASASLSLIATAFWLTAKCWRCAPMSTSWPTSGRRFAVDVWPRCVGLKQADIFALLERAIGRPIGPDVRERLWPRTRALFAAELKPTPGVIDYLGKLTTGRCVASSSQPERIRFSLETTGLTGFFGDAIFSTQDVARGKPAPDIYLYAAERMGAQPADVVVIEDFVPGVQGAKAAGAHAIGYLGGAHVEPDHGRRLLEAGADFVVRRLGCGRAGGHSARGLGAGASSSVSRRALVRLSGAFAGRSRRGPEFVSAAQAGACIRAPLFAKTARVSYSVGGNARQKRRCQGNRRSRDEDASL